MKKQLTATLTKGAKKVIRRRGYSRLEVQVGNVFVSGRNLSECRALTKFAKQLSKATPANVQVGDISVSAGANIAHAVEATKELAKSRPAMFKIFGISVKASSMKNALCGLAVAGSIIVALKVGTPWIKERLSKRKDSSDSPNEGNELLPQVQTVNEIRKERTIENYDDGQLVGKLIYKGDKVILFSESGTGKTVLAMGLALDIASGHASKIIPDDKGNHKPQMVFYYDGENDPEDYYKIFGEHEVDTENLFFIRKFYYETPQEWLEDLRKNLTGIQGDVTVILDNISCIMSTFNANVVKQLFNRDLNKIQNDFAPNKVTFIVVAHTNKQKELMGSNNQHNFATSLIKLRELDEHSLQLEVIKDRKYGDMKGKSFLLAKRETEDGYKYDEYVSTISSDEKNCSSKADNIPPETIRAIKAWYQKGVSGRGYLSVIKEFQLDTKYGITDPNEVKRII